MAGNLPLKHHSKPAINTFLTAVTNSSKTRLQWSNGVVWIDLLTRFNLSPLYTSTDSLPQLQGTSLRWLPSVPNEQHMLTREPLHASVANTLLNPM